MKKLILLLVMLFIGVTIVNATNNTRKIKDDTQATNQEENNLQLIEQDDTCSMLADEVEVSVCGYSGCNPYVWEVVYSNCSFKIQ